MSDQVDINTLQKPLENEGKMEGAPPFRYYIPEEPGKKSAMLLAGLMHVLLFLFLWIGVRWQSKEPVGFDAEIWDMTTRQAAPRPQSAAPPRLVVEKPAPKVIKPEVIPPAPDREYEQKVEIALQRELEKKNRAEKLKAENLKKRAEEKKQQDDLAKAQNEKKQEQARLEEQKKADAIAKKQREDNLKRLTSQVAGTGDAVKSTGNNRVDPGYAGRIAAKIKSNMVYVGTDGGSDNPTADFKINLFPDGSLRGAPVKTASSGVPAFDDAVERAIIKSAPYPADKSGDVPSVIPLTYRLKD